MANKQKKILIAEDEKPIARALYLKLTRAGFLAKIASNGEEVLQMLEKEKFDMILLDLIMPKMDGFQVLETMSRRKMKNRVIVTSNLGQEEDFKRAKELGAEGYFIKSNTPISLIVDYVIKNILV